MAQISLQRYRSLKLLHHHVIKAKLQPALCLVEGALLSTPYQGANVERTLGGYTLFGSKPIFYQLGPGSINSWSHARVGGYVLSRTFLTTGRQEMASKDLYEVLGINKGASQAELKKAYYEMAKKHHPDMNKSDPDAEKKFQEIQQAYEVLKDDEKRAMYDRVGHSAYEQAASGGGPSGSPGGFTGFDFGDFGEGGMAEMLRSMFGRGSPSDGGRTLQLNLELSFREAVEGCRKPVTFYAPVTCSECKGTGVPPGVKPETCSTCRGSGRVTTQQGLFHLQMSCPDCSGSGRSVKEHCKVCGGRGTITEKKLVNVDIPAGVDSGMTIKVSGAGGAGVRGSRAGDLIIQLKVQEDSVFHRDGSDIHVDASISFTQAILGGTVQVPTLTGDVMLKIRPGTQPGQKLVLRGKGIKVMNSNRHGDQFVHLRVSIPKNVSQQQRRLIEEYARLENGEDVHTAAGGSKF
ncbi:hypothetical protein O6H91_06G084400 [Diphasiastrum complanatum]|uniref:Uncharacterized protein n=5 Tax=Diphasiastrum complanatum TaxID=34168 RepID=A0ACC2DFH8_DIPCM|nr:hypothetical protein O6H91_06G084400 [Diphasiastrum complanatum]KAJ7553105.1 hypothetical protein O6H91_06G084400 [Diphasiastrum complanatum]KAJ7553106.1 hypothetical protein O6H91_06G084400 [Diphasiastrum complanatum]KAJ7553107.1 hypothetical protein O6H91_06G084400 [Diphasiastrum complanatum]KAJ7553109.1 hypothetical protein O6H91_06G084400 [Diphasiastrum complanatum]